MSSSFEKKSSDKEKGEERRRSSLEKIQSTVEALDQAGTVFRGFHIWTDIAPAVKADADLMFAKCLVLPGSTKDELMCRQVEPRDDSETEFKVPKNHAFNCNAQIDPMTYGDIGAIPHTNRPCVLDFLRHRFLNKQIYTSADPLLVAINPFKDLGNTTQKIIEEYRDTTDVSKLPPHVFATARTALENLHAVQKSQTIIVSGESGAGKTEATKQIMRYFAAAKSGTVDTRIQTAVLAANPVLEAFGNAKTLRNNNSSRFGRFMQLQVAASGGIEFGSILNFLLEKSRIVTQADGERGYHVFYQMLKGATGAQKSKWKLKGLSDYKFISPKCLDVDGIDDKQDWKEILESLESMQRTPQEVDAIFSIISGIMALGNVDITGGETAQISSSTRQWFTDACELLAVNPASLEEGFVVKFSYAGGETVRGNWNEHGADVLRLSMAKAVYDKLFAWIIVQLNKNIEPAAGFNEFMGMLDIFGFEVFPNNSLEQLFINITNEMLQKNFIDVVFDRETKLYRAEGISSADLQWTSNEPVIRTLTSKGKSVISVLEDQCIAPGSTDERFLSSTYSTLKGDDKCQPSKIQPNRNFTIDHTIGPIQYNCTDFLAKNSDNLRAELVDVIQASSNPVVRGLFEGVVVERGKIAKGQLISNQFMAQLTGLMALIDSTEPHFIRCVKPNEQKEPLGFTNSKVLVQLRALSILEALELRNLGYSYRRPFGEFLAQFRFVDLGITQNPSLKPVDACKELFAKTNLSPNDWQIGKTMVFMKPQTAKALSHIQRQQMAAWDPVILLLEAMAARKFLQEKVEQSTPGLIRFQSHSRKYGAIKG